MQESAVQAKAGQPARAETAVDEAAAGQAKRRSLRPLLGLAPYLTRYRVMLALAFVALMASAFAMLAVPAAVRQMMDHGFTGTDTRIVGHYFLLLIGIGALLAVASSGRFYCVNWLGERVVADLRSDVFRHLATLGPAFFERTHSAEIMSRLTADTTLMKSAAGSALSQALRNAVMLIGAVVMMFVTSVKLSLLVLIAIPLIVFPVMGYGRVVRRLSRRAQDTLAEASAYAAENLAAVRTMQAFTHEKAAAARFERDVETAFTAARERLRARAALTAVVIFLVVGSVVGVLWYGASAVINQQMSGGLLGQFVLYALFAGGALAELAEVWGEVQQAAGAAERLAELMATEPEVRSPPDPVALPSPAKGEIRFRDVTFTYPGRNTPALANVSFRVAPGETVALVGPSGAGKSTVLNLVLRFYDPQSGRIDLDGVGVHQADLNELRSRMSLVPQEVALFADTVIENIRYGTPQADFAAVERAARLAQADAFIRALPDGYETKLGERGINLSGGQRQRIAIARAIMRNAPVLLLDEATSALDAENERDVQTALEAVMAGRTTIVIAHRLATVQKADRILVIEGGRIIEEGTHATLVRSSGLYARLAELQFAMGEAQ